jgi:hypothetical protein
MAGHMPAVHTGSGLADTRCVIGGGVALSADADERLTAQ